MRRTARHAHGALRLSAPPPCLSSTCSPHACQRPCLSARVPASWAGSCPSWCSVLPQAALEHTALLLSARPPPPELHSFPSGSVPLGPRRLRSHCHRGPKSTEPILVSSLSFFTAHTHTQQETGSHSLRFRHPSAFDTYLSSGFFFQMNSVWL